MRNSSWLECLVSARSKLRRWFIGGAKPVQFRRLRLESLETRDLLAYIGVYILESPSEYTGTGSIEIYRGFQGSPPYDDTVTISYTVQGASGDISLTSGQVNLGPNDAGKELDITVLDDTTYEPNESFTVTITSAVSSDSESEYDIDYFGTGSTTETIEDNDPPPITFTTSGSCSETGPATCTVTMTRGGPLTDWLGITLDWNANEYHYSIDLDNDFYFQENESQLTFTLTPYDDCQYEPNQVGTFTVVDIFDSGHFSGDFPYVIPSPAPHIDVAIADNDSPSGFSIGNWTGGEGGTA